MTYVKQTWANGALGGTPISADRLNYIEAGLELATSNTINVSNYATLQLAYDAANALAIAEGSKVAVWHPPGIHILPAPFGNLPKRMATIYPNIILTGPGTVKVPNNAGNYGAIFGAPISTDLSNFEMQGLTVDVNATNNAVPGAGDMTIADNNESRCLVFITNGNHVKINDNTFNDVGDLVNGILVNGDGQSADDFECMHNIFNDVGQAAFSHDCSMIYWDGRRCNVIGNRIIARSAGLGGCTTGIELHGQGQRCTDNYVENFLLGGYTVTGQLGGDDIKWTDNRFKGVSVGIILLPYVIGAWTGPYGLSGVEIKGNSMYLDRDQWFTRTDLVGSTGHSGGIILQEATDLPCSNVDIHHNFIECKASVSASDVATSYKDAGISWVRTNPALIDRNVSISDNSIDGPYSSGILFNSALKTGTVRGNKIRNPGAHTNLTGAYRVGIFSSSPGAISGVRINLNLVTDDRGTHTTIGAIYISPSSTVEGSEALDNSLFLDDGDFERGVFSLGSVGNGGFYTRTFTPGYWGTTPPIDWAAWGSVLIDPVQPKEWVQTVAPEGATWVARIVP